MRELLSWRLVAAVAALALLAFIASSVLSDDDDLQAIVDPSPPERRIDLLAPVVDSLPSEDFTVDENGRTTGYLELLLTGGRSLRIVPGTLGEVGCDPFDDAVQCAVLADLLGDAAVWFTLLPQGPRQTVELPPVVDLDDATAVFGNGWRIAYAPVIERDCGDVDIPSFSEFLRRFGPDSVTIADLNTGIVTSVRCGDPQD